MPDPRGKEQVSGRHTPKPVRNPEAFAKQRRRLTAVTGKRKPARPLRESFGAQRGADRATLGPDHVVKNADRAHRRPSDVSGKLRDRPMIAVRIERRRRSDGVDFQSPTELAKPPRRTMPARIATRRGSRVSPVKEHRSRRHQRKPPKRRVRLPPPDCNEVARAVRAMRATPVRDEHNAGQTPPGGGFGDQRASPDGFVIGVRREHEPAGIRPTAACERRREAGHVHHSSSPSPQASWSRNALAASSRAWSGPACRR